MTMFSSLEQSISTDGLGKLTSIDVVNCIIIHVTVSVGVPQDAHDLSVVGSSSSVIYEHCCWSAPCRCYRSPSCYRNVDLLLTCRRLNHEATKMLYAETMFRFGSWDVINKFISRTPSSSLLHVRSVRIKIRKDLIPYYVMWTPTLHKLSTTTKCPSQPYLELDYRTSRWQRGQSMPLSLANEDGLSKGLMYLSDLQQKQSVVLISDPVTEEKSTCPSRSGERDIGTNLVADCP
jgi:hypothetical protein